MSGKVLIFRQRSLQHRPIHRPWLRDNILLKREVFPLYMANLLMGSEANTIQFRKVFGDSTVKAKNF